MAEPELTRLDEPQDVPDGGLKDSLRSGGLNTRTLKEQIVELIRDRILSGRIGPGERLNESKLARDLAVSRIPIREAFQQLQEQGLAVNQRRRGMFVVSLSDEEIQKINSLRIILEAEALRLCRARITPEGLGQMVGLVQRMEDSEGTVSEIGAAALDLEFHRSFWRYSGNDYLERTLESLVVPLFAHRVLWRLKREIRDWGHLLNHHRTIVDFLQGKIDTPAEQVMLTHLSFRFSDPARFSSLSVVRQTESGQSAKAPREDGLPDPAD
jgi:DNA-binding GntR family transcriptional regulator